MIWMNGRNRRGGGLFLLPGLLFGGIFGIYVILAVLNVAGVVIGAVFSGLAAAFSGVIGAIGYVFRTVFSRISFGIGPIGGVIVGIVIGLVLFNRIRNRKAAEETAKE